MKREELLLRVKRVVHEVEPDAEVILYGSRSRGDALSDSDWDFLIPLDGPVNDERTDRIRHQLYEIEWDQDLVLHRLARARETLGEARLLANAKRWNACVNCLYYGCFYAVSALLVKDGLSASKHTCARSRSDRPLAPRQAGQMVVEPARNFHRCVQELMAEHKCQEKRSGLEEDLSRRARHQVLRTQTYLK